jgi:RNA polymerase-associated protein
MLLYEHPLSSYAQKVKIALREKGVAFTAELPESFGTGRTDGPFAAANPRTEVPVLIDDEAAIFDSTVILEYIEDRWPEPPLLPRTPAARAFARLTEDVCDTQYEAVNWGFGEILWFRRATGALAERLRARAAAQTAVLQDWLAGRLGAADWFGGEDFGWADGAVAPMLNRSVHYGLGPPPGSPLARWHARVRERPSVAATFAEFDAAAARMAEAANLYTTGGRRREYRDHRLEWMVKSGGVEVVLAGLRDGNIRFPWPEGETP